MRVALLSVGMTHESAINDAEWSEPELELFKARAKRIKWSDIGNVIGLTFDEWDRCKMWFTRPIDVSEAEIAQWRNKRRKTQDSARKKRKREQERGEREAAHAANDRCEAVLRMLEGKRRLAPTSPGVTPPLYCGEWTSMPNLVELLIEKTRAFRRPDGRCLSKPRNAVRSTIKLLERLGQVETNLQSGPYGNVMMVRTAAVKSGEADAFSGRPAALSDSPAKPQKIRDFSSPPALSAGKADKRSVEPLSSPNAVPFKRRKVR
jgi:hypothetical protein